VCPERARFGFHREKKSHLQPRWSKLTTPKYPGFVSSPSSLNSHLLLPVLISAGLVKYGTIMMSSAERYVIVPRVGMKTVMEIFLQPVIVVLRKREE